jgi:hypothetical protein
MALINGNKFRKFTQSYYCDSKVFETVKEHIINNYCPSEHIQVGGCLITLTDNLRRWLLPRNKNRYLDLVNILGDSKEYANHQGNIPSINL